MAEHNDTGKRGEELARRYLEEQGFAIVETNWANSIIMLLQEIKIVVV